MDRKRAQNFLKFIGGYLALLTLLIVVATCTVSCDQIRHQVQPAVDSTYVAKAVIEYNNPQLMTVDDVLSFQQELIEQYDVEAQFRELPPNTVENISTVLFKRKVKQMTIYDIVKEYRANKDIYDSLPTAQTETQDSTPQQVDLQSTDLGSKRDGRTIISTSYQTVDDTIDGKPVKVTIKTEKSYE